MVISALRLLLIDGNDPLGKSVLVSSLLTWVILVGGAYGALRLVADVVRFFRIYWRPGRPPAPPSSGVSR